MDGSSVIGPLGRRSPSPTVVDDILRDEVLSPESLAALPVPVEEVAANSFVVAVLVGDRGHHNL